MRASLLLAAAVLVVASPSRALDPGAAPNIVVILADDLGWGDLGSYGQQRIRTPRLDQLAREGARFSQFYSGSTVCAPARAVLMTGQHTGRTRIRGNARIPLRAEDVSLAEVLGRAGYETGAFGKWGLGDPGSSGVPGAQGFDAWFGYLNQRHAHNYWPDHLWRNQERVELPNWVLPMGQGSGVALRRKIYAPELILDEAVEFIQRARSRPFFLYFAPTLPHANNEALYWGMEVPSEAPYESEPWPRAQRRYAAMVTLLDAQVGRLLDVISERGLAEETLIIFTSDNGPHAEGGADPAFFDSSGGLRGIKRDLYEGGIRVPLLVRWPGRVPGGLVSDAPHALWDLLPTLAEVAGIDPPKEIDGVSVLPLWLGKSRLEASADRLLYWEFHSGGPTRQAARRGRWKALRQRPSGPVELYDLENDPFEQHDIASEHPEVVAELVAGMQSSRTDVDEWPLRD